MRPNQLPAAVLNRRDFERVVHIALLALGTPDSLVPRIVERSYPKSTGAIVEELRLRGLDVTATDVESWGMENGVHLVHGVLRWHETDADALAGDAAARGLLTDAARDRQARGVTARTAVHDLAKSYSSDLERRAATCAN